MTDFTLNLDGKKHGGWKDLSITLGLDQLAHSFSVGLTDQWSDQQERTPIIAGNPVKVGYGSKIITTGYIDDDSTSYDKSSRSISISGRSKTGDLVDCAAGRADKKRAWRNVGLLQIAKDLCDPFGISVSSNVNLGEKFRFFTIEEGETAYACIQRAARMRGVLMLTDSNGDLVLDRVGTSKIETVIKLGENIISGGANRSMRGRFSSYTIKCQTTGSDETADSPKSITLKRSSIDDGVSRYRPTIVMADNEDNGTELQKRADWERNTRAGASRTFTYKVRGWEHSKGLWMPNNLVRAIDSYNWLDAELLISQVNFQRGSSGTFTNLTLKAPEAFDIQPLFTPARPATQRKKSSILGGWLGS